MIFGKVTSAKAMAEVKKYEAASIVSHMRIRRSSPNLNAHARTRPASRTPVIFRSLPTSL